MVYILYGKREGAKIAKIYNEEGWLNWDYLYPECRFIMTITGPRGTGKTYGLLKYIVDHSIKFIYIRRLKSQLDNVASGEESNPFKAINEDTGSCIVPECKHGALRFVDNTNEDNPLVIGYGVALSTVATIRGSDYSDVKAIIFDEYIAMKTERPIKAEYQAFMNFLETVNRNRELKGIDPVKVFMLGNANKLMNPYFLEWAFMKTALKMIHGDQMVWRNQDSSRIMILLLHSPISDRKRETALYKNANDDFISMAIDNSFEVDPTRIGARKLTDCRHIVSFGSIGIYQLKSTGEYYVSETVNKSLYYEENGINLKLFQARFSLLKQMYIYGTILFENYDVEMLFREYFQIV